MGKWDWGLSHNKLSLLSGTDACERCFFDHNKLKIERPKGIFPSLPNGIDDRTKAYFDRYRGSLPPILQGLLPGVLWGDAEQIRKVRHWNSNHKPTIPTPHGVASLIGAWDDVLQRRDSFLSIIDYKSKGEVPPAGYAERYYQTQADLYFVQAKLAGLNPHPETFFVFTTPEEFDRDYAIPDAVPIRFLVTVQVVIAHQEDGMDLIMKGTEILSGPRPLPGATCAHCAWAKKIADLESVPAA